MSSKKPKLGHPKKLAALKASLEMIPQEAHPKPAEPWHERVLSDLQDYVHEIFGRDAARALEWDPYAQWFATEVEYAWQVPGPDNLFPEEMAIFCLAKIHLNFKPDLATIDDQLLTALARYKAMLGMCNRAAREMFVTRNAPVLGPLP